ncbi:MAG: zf-HC2 domain-containing protein [bacterium]|nr:zf-HC2 domain-containing protein [bacterium]
MKINCVNCGPELAAWAAGELEADMREAVAVHLADCPACRAELDRELALRAALAHLPAAACPDAVSRRVLDVIAAEQSGIRRRRQRLVAGVTLAAATVAVALILRPGTTPTPQAPIAQVAAPQERAAAPAPLDPAAYAAAVAASGYTPEQVAAARRDLIQTVALAARVIDRTGRGAISDVFSEQLPAAVTGSLRLSNDPTRGG